MLRPLHVWQTDANGNLVLDERGERVVLKGQSAGQPKAPDELSAGERATLAQQERDEEEWLLRTGRAQLEREALLAAARATIAAGAEKPRSTRTK
jgi:hypothetical protein